MATGQRSRNTIESVFFFAATYCDQRAEGRVGVFGSSFLFASGRLGSTSKRCWPLTGMLNASLLDRHPFVWCILLLLGVGKKPLVA